METEIRNSGASTNVMGSGIRNVINPAGKSYYILEHRATSRFHQAGEQQKIIVDNVVIGRDSSCQVRYDDDFKTVSRKHASIVREGDRWKLIPLSATNSTFVNGVKVISEQYLNTGDEIQVSANGPKLVFTIPGNASQPGGNMGDLGLTARLQLYSQQALKPYRRALIAGGIALLLAIGGLVWVIFGINRLDDNINAITAQMMDKFDHQSEQMDSLAQELAKTNQDVVDAMTTIGEVSKVANSAMSIATAAHQAAGPAPGVYAGLSKHVYFIQVVLEFNGQQAAVASGTGFMLKGGKFVTARHCVDLGYQRKDELNDAYNITLNTLVNFYPDNVKVHLYAVSGAGKTLDYEVNLNGGPWVMGNTEKATTHMTLQDENGESQEYPVKYNVNLPGDDDWAYIQTNETDGLDYDPALSSSLKVGTPVAILGFPRGMGVERLEDTGKVYPQLDKTQVCWEGLYPANGSILLGSDHIEHGNAGGPAFALNSAGKTVVIGIVSGLDAQGLYLNTADRFTNLVGRLVPISALK